MHPAPSIILFTTLSGAGYGLLLLLGLGLPGGLFGADRVVGLSALVLALGLVTVGFSLSMAHLGHPQRAWRALTQWRSSWLSREGVLAVLTYLPALVLALGWWFGPGPGWIAIAGLLSAAGAVATVVCTAMIYASLRPIRQWRQPLVPPVYLGFALMTGALLAHLVLAAFGVPRVWAGVLSMLAILLAFGLKLAYWQAIAGAGRLATAGSAIGLGDGHQVRLVEPPHTQSNYLLDEMGYRVARRHARKLRRLALVVGGAAPLLLTALAMAATGVTAALLAVLAALGGLVGVVIERWLFFAEASHTVTLYYGRDVV